MSSTVEQEQETSLDITLDELIIKENELSNLRAEIKGLRDTAEFLMTDLGWTEHKHTNFTLHFRTNSESHRMNWKRFQKEIAAIYKQLRKKNIVTLKKPTKIQSLVITKVKVNGT